MSRCIFRNRIFFLSLILIVYGLYGWARSQRFGGPTALIGFGCIQGTVCFADLNRPFLPAGAAIFPTGGYDGQFYYYTAVSLYSHAQLAELSDRQIDNQPSAKIVYVDSLPFRLPRIGFPLLSGWLYWLGPEALALGMPLFLLFVHLIACYVLFRFRPAAGWIVGLNPISLLSFGLNLAEPIAISFAAVAVVLFLKKAHWPWIAAMLASLALLSKETMFICGFSLGLALLYSIYVRRSQYLRSIMGISRALGPDADAKESGWQFARNNRWPGMKSVTLLLLAGLIAGVWYKGAGFFDGGAAASKPQIPFLGVYDFLLVRPALLSGRGLLLVGLIWIAATSIILLYRIHFRRPTGWLERRMLLWLLPMSLILVSMAGAEYWENFANIARLFAPAVVGLAMLRQRWMSRISLGWAGLMSLLLLWNDLQHVQL